MEIDPLEILNSATGEDAADRNRASARLNTVVAITVSLLATFLGVCKVKDDNIVQAMQQAQADKLDHWAYYQARVLREEVATATARQLHLQSAAASAAQSAAYQEAVADYEKLAAEQAQKKQDVRAEAEQDQKNYDALNIHDDQFDLSDALLAIAISMLAVTALTQKRWMYALALLPIGGGVLMGLAGLLGWQLHSGVLARLLS